MLQLKVWHAIGLIPKKPLVVKEFALKKKDYAPLALLFVSVALMAISIILKSTLVIAGVTGLVIAWFLSIDTLISSSKLSLTYRILLAGIAIGLPIAITIYM